MPVIKFTRTTWCRIQSLKGDLLRAEKSELDAGDW